MADSRWDVVVIGGGPAGLAAALMLGRSRRRVLVVDAGSPRNRFAAHMHGVLGNEGVDPAELLARGRDEVAAFGVEVSEGTVDRVDLIDGGVRVELGGGVTHEARAVLVATGITDDLPPVPGLAERWGATVLHCPYCHGWEVRDGRLGVLVTSPLGFHQAELVRQLSDRVTVFAAGVEPDEVTRRRLRARGVELVGSPVTEIAGEGAAIEAVRTADGTAHLIDALFTVAQPRTHGAFLSHLDLARNETPFGSYLAVDQAGKTSDDGIWAAGNVVNPMANVPMSIGAGTMAGAALNGWLVTQDFDAAVASQGWPQVAPADFWEDRYAGSDRVWSGRPNHSVTRVARDLRAGTALELGCGEGADALWLAQQGWEVTAIDISPTAIRRATEAARAVGVPPERVRFVAADLAEWSDGQTYDLVTAGFLHSPVELDRTAALRRAAGRVRPGGHLLVVSHAAAPPWADAHDHHFLTPSEEVDALGLDPASWQVLIAEVRGRPATGPDGREAVLDDSVILLRRE
ncbi:MAG TPA: FAD-dependent oxidoreductase [Micropruina sp.]|nr:FAD-dependent oxidoreductase [Micropruina sp.]